MATTRELAIECAKVCDDTKAERIIVLDVRKLTSIADYFIICSSAGERQSRAVAENLRAMLKPLGVRLRGIEGLEDGRWVLADFGDVVVHIFQASERAFYDVEGLWADGRNVRWKSAAAKA